MNANEAPVLVRDEAADVLGTLVVLDGVKLGRVKKHTTRANTWCCTSVHNGWDGRRISSTTNRTRTQAIDFLVRVHGNALAGRYAKQA